MIQLTDEEIQACYNGWDIETSELRSLDNLLLKAQLKKVVEWLKTYEVWGREGNEDFLCGVDVDLGGYQALLEEVKE